MQVSADKGWAGGVADINELQPVGGGDVGGIAVGGEDNVLERPAALVLACKRRASGVADVNDPQPACVGGDVGSVAIGREGDALGDARGVVGTGECWGAADRFGSGAIPGFERDQVTDGAAVVRRRREGQSGVAVGIENPC